MTGQDKTGQEGTGQDRIGQDGTRRTSQGNTITQSIISLTLFQLHNIDQHSLQLRKPQTLAGMWGGIRYLETCDWRWRILTQDYNKLLSISSIQGNNY